MISYGMTDIGKKRSMNQDYLFYSDKPIGPFPNLYIVADGMGGHKAGDKASSYAVTRFVELAKHVRKRIPFLMMEEVISQVNEEVYKLSEKEEQYAGMGTTMGAATRLDGKVYVMNIGDSRLYCYRAKDQNIKQLTLDHSLVEELIRAGELERSESRNHPQKNIITRAIGVSGEVNPDFFMEDLEEGDRILLCSDGLSYMEDDEKLGCFRRDSENPERACAECIDEALFFGGIDNIAVVIAQYDGGRELC